MSPLVALVTGVVVGALVVAVGVLLARRRSDRAERAGSDAERDGAAEAQLARRLLDLMDPAVLLLDKDDAVVVANPTARGLGIVRDRRLVVPALQDLVGEVRRWGSRRSDVSLPGEVVGGGTRLVGAHGIRLDASPGDVTPSAVPGPVALVLQDVTEARRVEAVRRDFVANVGHELKTPVGALGLLAEAMQGAADDPETVQRFATRMAHEADRLARLVRELIDLSRLQGAEPLPELTPVDVDTVLAEAVDRTGLAAAAKGITIAVGGGRCLLVRGVEAQLATAVTNLLANAVAYSPENTKIAVGARARGGFAEIAVTDSGIGIPRADRERVFERFYRVDQSRATRTGGTGLGLAIVKHVASNHGGSVSVWSEEGLGSTFTLRIPLAVEDRPEPPAAASDAGGVLQEGRS
ncbi:sensor histidine kinase [Geodermatophilus amargosae]|uniref:sensor histidine kinase n=1 Tax=Geodermatophilus amargosae TaxID=1296565 RepID=UPI0034DF1FE7